MAPEWILMHKLSEVIPFTISSTGTYKLYTQPLYTYNIIIGRRPQSIIIHEIEAKINENIPKEPISDLFLLQNLYLPAKAIYSPLLYTVQWS